MTLPRAKWLRFEEPCRIISTCSTEEVLPALRAIEALVHEHGWHAAGFLSYEAGSAFDAALRSHAVRDFPLLWFGLYANAEETDLPDPNYAAYSLADPEPCISRAEYDQAIGRVKRYIESGDTYQVNYTLRLHAAFHGDPWHLFLAMVRAQMIPDSRLKPQIRNPESGIGIGGLCRVCRYGALCHLLGFARAVLPARKRSPDLQAHEGNRSSRAHAG